MSQIEMQHPHPDRSALSEDTATWLAAEIVGEPDDRGGAIWMGCETWGLVIDALMEHQQASERRKVGNSESTCDMRAEACAYLIQLMNHMATIRKPTPLIEYGANFKTVVPVWR
jgi:hypothetical protein